MKRILINNQQMNGLSWYRVQGVFSYLEKEMDNVVFSYTKDSDTWREMFRWDIVHFNRAFGVQSLEVLRNLKLLKKQIWLDFDDNIFKLDKQHQHYNAFLDNNAIEANKEIIRLADVVTVTTKFLKDLFAEYNDNIIVIPNSYNDHIFPFRDMSNTVRNNLIVWRGSNFHRHDLYDFKDQITEVTKDSRFKWVFMGDDPWFIKTNDNENNILYIAPKDAVAFYKDLYTASPLLFHVPLKNDDFNLAKSNIAMLEAVLAGTTILAPKTEEWEHDGVFTYTSKEDYLTKLKALSCSTNTYIEKYYNLLVEEVKDKFLLSKNNNLRKEIIRNL